jgi:hypothetical protein
MTATAAARTYALDHDNHLVIVTGDLTAEPVAVYRPDEARATYLSRDDLCVLPGEGHHQLIEIRLTAAQRNVAEIRFSDVATDEDNFGADVTQDGPHSTLVVTNVAEALATLDNAADICRDNINSGYNARAYARELAVTLRLFGKIVAEIR